MDNQTIIAAQQAYQARDFRNAYALFSQVLVDEQTPKGPGDVGYLYHQMGNCLLQLQDYQGAIQVYTEAAADTAYDACGAVNCNLAKAYASLHDYVDAVSHFEIAVSDAKYPTPYKAYMGMGQALLKLGKNAEAGVAFREAALDQTNPDPSKALLNLGVCFMALNRPADAVQSYESALQFDMDASTRNKMYASLGQAYVACNQMPQAMSAFENALADKTYFLSGSASVDYSRAAKAVATGTATMPVVVPDEDEPEADMSGIDVVVETAAAPQNVQTMQNVENDPRYFPAEAYGYDVQDGYTSGDDRFFNATDEELERYSKGIAKQDRKRRNVGLKVLVVLFALLVVAAAAGVYLYTQGYGWPTQESVVSSLFADTAHAEEYFADSVSSDSIQATMREVVQDSDVTIDGVEKSMSSSTVYATAHAEGGGEVSYRVDLVRDMIGWKVADVKLFFQSQM